MATNKHAIIRYQALDKCFRNPGRKYFMDDLIEACNQAIYDYSGNTEGIKRRQLFDDINYMQSEAGFNIPLEKIKEGKKVYYRYEDMSFSINNQPLNQNEENQLKEALLTLARFKGMPQFEWVDELTARLDSGLGLSNLEHPIIEFEQNFYLKGLEHITPIYEAIIYKKPLSISYKSFKQLESQQVNFHPYYLKQYNNRWFAFGWNDEFANVQNIALDRIEKVEENPIQFIPNKEIDFNEFFEDVIGVTVPSEKQIENIVLQVENSLAPYIITKPIHGSQKVKSNDELHTFITLDLIPNYELEATLLSHGEKLTVLSPESLKLKLKDRIETMKNNYNS